MTALNRVLLLGNRTLAIGVLDLLRRETGVEILAVANPDDDGRDGPGGLSLRRRLDAWRVPYLQPKGLKDSDTRATLAKFKPDLAISCSYARIIPPEVIDLPRHGCLNVHYAALPKNRGCLPVIWTIATGEPEFAATLHMVTEGLDEGAILAQARRSLTPGMTAGEAYAACALLGRDLFAEFWRTARDTGKFVAVPQGTAAATYHTLRFPYDRWIPWQLPAAEVANTINALTYLPHPSARTRRKGHSDDGEICLLGAALAVDDARAEPGRVIASDGTLLVGCGVGAVSVAAARRGNDAIPVEQVLAAGQTLASPVMERYSA